jgi:chromosome segregation ATPase
MSDKEPAAENRARRLEEANKALEDRLLDMEKQLLAEREKQANVNHVETALKDMQEKLRREKREQELDAARQAAEAKIKDLERRLAEERDMWVNLLKDQALKGPDTQPLKAEIATLRESLAVKDTALASAQDEVKLLKQSAEGQDKNLERHVEEMTLRISSLQQALVEKDAEKEELLRQLESSRQDAESAPKNVPVEASASPDLERDRSVLQKRIKEQADYAAKLKARAADLEREVSERDKIVGNLRVESQELQKRVAQLTASKDAETRLLRENMQRLGRQNKELLVKLQELAGIDPNDEDSPANHGPGPVTPGMHAMLSSLESALTGRDRMLADQQKSLEEKKGLIEGLFHDLKSLDEQAVSLLEEKNRVAQEMSDRVSALTTENDALRRRLEGQ